MFRFSIRDVLWLTVVVAFAVAWSIDHIAASQLRSEMQVKAAADATQLETERADKERWRKHYLKSASRLKEILDKIQNVRLQVEGVDDSAAIHRSH